MQCKPFGELLRIDILVILIQIGSMFIVGCSQQSDDYKPKVLDEARIWKSKIESDIQTAVEEIRKIASSLVAMKQNGSPGRDAANNLIKQTLKKHPEYLAIWTCWEPNAFDNLDVKYQNLSGHDKNGRFMPCWNRVNGAIEVVPFDIYSKNNDTTYRELIRAGREIVSNPIFFSIGENKRLKVIYAVPINYEGKIIGAAGIDLPLFEFFTPIIRQVRVLDVAHGFLIANNGVLVAHPIKWANVGKSLDFFAFEEDVIQAVKDGREASQAKISRVTGNKAYYQFVPIKFGDTNKPWSLAISLMPELLNDRGPKVTW